MLENRKDWHDRKSGSLNFRFFCYLYVLFSFVLIQKKKYQKEKIKAASARLLRSHPRLKGRNSLRSNSLPFFTPGIRPTLDAVQTRPGELCSALGGGDLYVDLLLEQQ